jgi:hypothetical protein
LTDIEFLNNGDMVIGLRDRFSDQIGFLDPGPKEQKPKGSDVVAVAAGDLLRASPNSSGGWVIESNGQSVPPGRFGPTAGTNNAEGPDNGEFYFGDVNGLNSHDESSYGGMAQIPGVPEVIEGFADPLRQYSAGMAWMSHTNGSRNRAFQLYEANNARGTFAKANGLGDLEVLCEAAPIEIGNRVWYDADFNGIQDPAEAPLPGIVVALSDDTGVIAQATTDGDGHYYFSNAITPTRPSDGTEILSGPRLAEAVNAALVYAVPIVYNKTYTVSVDMGQPAIARYQLTSPNKSDHSADGDIRDSDGLRAGTVTYVTFQTGVPRQNNHSFDFGFNIAPQQPESVRLGNQVWYDVNNNGMLDDGEVGVNGVAVQLYADSNGNGTYNVGDALISSTITSPGGFYNFINLTPTQSVNTAYLVVLPASNFCAGGVLVNYQNSTGSVGGNSDENAQDHGLDAGTLTCGGLVASSAVSLTAGGEPINDGDTDPNSNLSIDFGFYKLELGNLVWLDTDNSGTVNAGEIPLANIAVRLLGSNLDVLANTTTNASGFYTFTNLVAGTYCAEITPPTGHDSSTGPGQSDNPDDNVDDDDNGVITTTTNIRSNCMALAPGAEPLVITSTGTTQNPTLDFGVFVRPVITTPVTPTLLSGLGNYTWFDADKDGAQDAGGDEKPIPNVPVTLRTSAGAVLSQTQTNLQGFYIFTGLIPSSYYVCFGTVTGYTYTVWMSGTTMTSDADSNANPINSGCTMSVTLQPGEFNPTLDAGFIITNTLPQAIGLNSFSVARNRNGAGLLVSWQTGVELNTFGFSLYRSTGANRASATRVTPEVIAGRGAGSYSFVDASADVNQNYTYWLVEIETSGQMNEYAPATYAPSGAVSAVAAAVPVPVVIVDGVPTGNGFSVAAEAEQRNAEPAPAPQLALPVNSAVVQPALTPSKLQASDTRNAANPITTAREPEQTAAQVWPAPQSQQVPVRAVQTQSTQSSEANASASAGASAPRAAIDKGRAEVQAQVVAATGQQQAQRAPQRHPLWVLRMVGMMTALVFMGAGLVVLSAVIAGRRR